jgi:Rrf2 family nitric oxide-sensitive transcriptional repressor
VVECLEKDGGNCVIAPSCRLQGLLRNATGRFLEELDAHSLEDVLQPAAPLSRLLGIEIVTEPVRRGA